MSKKRKPRKLMSHEELVIRCWTAMNFAIFKAKPDVPDYTREGWINDAEHALDVLLVTRGTTQEMVAAWRTAADCFNIAEQITHEGIAGGMEHIKPAQIALSEQYKRAASAGYTSASWSLTGAQIKALRTGLEAFTIQLQDAAITGKEWADLTARCAERCREARLHAGDGQVHNDVMVVNFPGLDLAISAQN